jgi:hypothetical protein
VTLKETNTECLEWQGCRDDLGYGKCSRHVDGVRYVLAHRWAWAEANGPIPGDLLVCHTCDNPSCCNVAHMFLGTDADNTADRDRKGRGLRGRSRYSTEDTDEMARMWSEGWVLREIGEQFGCTGQHVRWLIRQATVEE